MAFKGKELVVNMETPGAKTIKSLKKWYQVEFSSQLLLNCYNYRYNKQLQQQKQLPVLLLPLLLLLLLLKLNKSTSINALNIFIS